MIDQFIIKNRYLLLLFLFGLILAGLGLFYVRNGGSIDSNKIEVLGGTSGAVDTTPEIVVEIAGAVEKPGVYKLPLDSRVDDLLIAGGGLSGDADRGWVEKNVNRAAKLSDGQKLYIFSVKEVSANDTETSVGGGGVVQNGLININTADANSLDSLPGIGPVYAQKIIEHRPYSTVQEVVSKGGVTASIYEKIKDKITAF